MLLSLHWNAGQNDDVKIANTSFENIGGEGRKPLEGPRHSSVDNIKMDCRDIGYGSMDWTELAEDRDQWRAVVIMVMNVWVP
jgi:hypothetical protein